jgi:hypothetical protein
MWELAVSDRNVSADSALGLPDPGPGWQSVNGHPFAGGELSPFDFARSPKRAG